MRRGTALLLLTCFFQSRRLLANSQQVCFELEFSTPSEDENFCRFPGSEATFVVTSDAGEALRLPSECSEEGEDCKVNYCVDEEDIHESGDVSLVVSLAPGQQNSNDGWIFSLEVEDEISVSLKVCREQVPNQIDICSCGEDHYVDYLNYVQNSNDAPEFLIQRALLDEIRNNNGENNSAILLVGGTLGILATGLIAAAVIMRKRKNNTAVNPAEHKDDYLRSELMSKDDIPVTVITAPSTATYSNYGTTAASFNDFPRTPKTIASKSPDGFSKRSSTSNNPRFFSDDVVSLSTFFSTNFSNRSSFLINPPRKFSVQKYKLAVTESDRTEIDKLRQTVKHRASTRTKKTSVSIRSVSPSISFETEQRLLRLQEVMIDCVVASAENYLKARNPGATPAATQYRRTDENGALLRKMPLAEFLMKVRHYVNEWTDEDDSAGNSLGNKSLVMSLIYLRRLKRKSSTLEINDSNIRNLFFVAIIVATKFLDDWVIPSAYWADLVGVDVATLNEMERTFSKGLDYDFFISERRIKSILVEFEKHLKKNLS